MWKQMYEQERARWSDEPRDHPPDLDLASELAIVNFGFDRSGRATDRQRSLLSE